MKFIENQKYLLIGEDFEVKVTFAGFAKTESNYRCFHCKKDRANIFEFIEGDVNNPSAIIHLGSECVKRYKFELLS
jgi:hypothetical protein